MNRRVTEEGQNLSIADVAERTGVRESTLRMWERRYGFPSPSRLPGGHRRYSAAEVERVQRVLAERDGGLTLSAAVDRVSGSEASPRSLFAGLRRSFPGLEASPMRKPIVLALTRAIEDESCARAERALLFGAFQRSRYYRSSAQRWRDLARSAELTVAFADFERYRPPREDAAAEVPLDQTHPLSREWALICHAAEHAACLSAWEPPGQDPATGERVFEVLWSVEPDVVREAARLASTLVEPSSPELAGRALRRLDRDPAAPASGQLRLATAVTRRMLSELGSA